MTSKAMVGIDASRSYRLPMTGTERYSQRLIESILDVSDRDHRYRLYFNSLPPDGAPLESAEKRVIPQRRFWTHLRLSRELARHPVDLLFVPSHVLPVRHPPRSIVTIHDLGYLYHPEAHTLSSRIQLDVTTRWNARESTHLIAISESTKRDLVEQYGVPSERITVVPHGVDRRFRILETDEVERYRRAAKLPARFILYLGTIQPRKNLVRLIEAFEQIRDQDTELVLAGAVGWLAREIRSRAEASRVRDRIRFLGYVPDEQLPLLYNAATAFCLPSLYEGFGIPILEAMACGVPVVVSNRGALPEVAGADALIIDPERTDEIARALLTAIDRRFDQEKALERVEFASGFTWDQAASRTLDVFDQVLNTGD